MVVAIHLGIVCTKYGRYTLMELPSNKIVDFQCVHVSQAGNSNNMEKKGIFMLLEKTKEKGISIKSITTDRHVQIRRLSYHRPSVRRLACQQKYQKETFGSIAYIYTGL